MVREVETIAMEAEAEALRIEGELADIVADAFTEWKQTGPTCSHKEAGEFAGRLALTLMEHAIAHSEADPKIAVAYASLIGGIANKLIDSIVLATRCAKSG